MTTWPETLPRSLLLNGQSETIGTTVVRTQMDIGPAKTRRRFTAEVRTFGGTMLMTGAQVASLDGFFNTTLAGGALRFDFPDPRTGATAAFRFVSPPVITPLGNDRYSVEMSLERLP